MNEQPWQVRRVYGEQALESIDILREASLWTARFGQPIWPLESFTIEDHRDIAAAGEQIGGFEDSKMVACMRLQTRDHLFWPDDRPGEALYLHKLAVRRASSGRGWSARMVEWAVRECRQKRVRALRLDTLANTSLPLLYKRLGFDLVDETPRIVEQAPTVRMQLWIDPDYR
jgi:GNAT superfamily N-acetyltransferase